MPRRPYREEEPLYANMANWNDGYEYVAPDHDPRGPSSNRSSHNTERLPERRNTEPRRRHEEAPRRSRHHSPDPYEDRSRDRSRDRPRHGDNRSPPRAPRDRRYPPAARHGRPPLDTGYYDDPPRQRPSHNRSNSFSASPTRRYDERRDDRNHENRGRDHPKHSLTRSKSMKERGVAAMGYLQDPRLQAAAAAAFAAGSQAAFRTPGAWNAQKGRKIATAALGAAALDAMAKSGKNGGDNRHRASSRDRAPKKSSGKSGIGSKLGGFVLDQLVKKGSQGRH